MYRVRDNAAPIEQRLPTSSPSLPLPDKPSIAVLPFANLSGDPEEEYFADGMIEEITTALCRLRWFFVIARFSTLAYKEKSVDVKEAGRELGVRYVLEGSVRKSGNRIRVAAQLIDAASGSHVWAERYVRELADIFAVQDEITERVVAAIEPQLYAAEHLRSQRKPSESLDAWECVIRALSALGRGTRDGVAEAESAIAIAPGYAQAHSLLAWALVRGVAGSGSDIRTVLPEASAEARAAGSDRARVAGSPSIRPLREKGGGLAVPRLLLDRKAPVRRPHGRPRKQRRVTSEKAPEAPMELFGVAQREAAFLSRRLWWVEPDRRGWRVERACGLRSRRRQRLTQIGRSGASARMQARRQRRLTGRRRQVRVIGTQIGTGPRRTSRIHRTSRHTRRADIGAFSTVRTGRHAHSRITKPLHCHCANPAF